MISEKALRSQTVEVAKGQRSYVFRKVPLHSYQIPERELETKLEGDRFVEALISSTNKQLSLEIEDYITSFCRTQCEAAMHILLGISVSNEVISTAVTITTKWTLRKCFNLAKLKARAKLEEDVVKAFEKGHRALTFHLKAQLTTHGTSGLGATKECLHLDYDKYTSQLSLFKDTCNNYLQSTPRKLSSDEYQNLLAAVFSVIELLQCRAFILPGIPSPPQVISTPLAKYMELSMDLVTYLVSCASFKPSQPQESILVSGCGLLDKLVEGWKLCRELKVEVCVNKLLSATAFDSYMKNEAEHGMDGEVWRALACVLATLVCNSIVSSALVEGLWLCRWHLVRKDANKVEIFHKAVLIFLYQWRSLAHIIKDCKEIFMPVHFVRLKCIMPPPTL